MPWKNVLQGLELEGPANQSAPAKENDNPTCAVRTTLEIRKQGGIRMCVHERTLRRIHSKAWSSILPRWQGDKTGTTIFLRRSTSAKAPPVAAIIRKNRRHLNDLTAFICPIVVIVQSLRENREGTIESTDGLGWIVVSTCRGPRACWRKLSTLKS